MLLDDTLTGGERTVSLAEDRVREVLAGQGLAPELTDWGDGGEPTAFWPVIAPTTASWPRRSCTP